MEKKRTNLAISRCKGHPGGTCPPSDNEAKESGILWSRAFSCPNIDGAREWESGAYLSQHSCRDHHEDDRDEVRRPANERYEPSYLKGGCAYQTAAGPPAKSPRNRADLESTQKKNLIRKDVYRPNTSNEVQRAETGCKTFE